MEYYINNSAMGPSRLIHKILDSKELKLANMNATRSKWTSYLWPDYFGISIVINMSHILKARIIIWSRVRRDHKLYDYCVY